MKDTAPARHDLDAINAMDRDAFVATFGAVFEDSPWAAAAAWRLRPFTSRGDVAEALCEAVRNAGRARQLALLRAHPELGARRPLTGYSADEQARAGLQRQPGEQHKLLAEMNRRYRDKFGFPFILAVKGLEPDTIIRLFRERLENSPAEEFNTCLAQVFRIAAFRLEDVLEPA